MRKGEPIEYIKIDTDAHRDIVISFRRDSFIASFGSDEDFGDEQEYLEWLNIKAAQYPDGIVLVFYQGKPIGQLELTSTKFENRTIGYVNLYYLVPGKRGMGIGKKLHDYALDFFKNQKLSEYHLRVSPTNQMAISFYQKMGMEKIGFEMDGKVMRMKVQL